MKIKTSELIGPALDWAVAEALGLNLVKLHDHMRAKAAENNYTGNLEWHISMQPNIWMWVDDANAVHHIEPYSSAWSQGGPVSEDNLICSEYDKEWVYDPGNVDPDDEPDNGDRWMAWPADNRTLSQYGPTELVAKMRCYVASKLGDEIDIPEELC